MRVTIPQIGTAGVIKDQQPHELPIQALSDVLNIRMRDGAAERIGGEVNVFNTPAVTPHYVTTYQTSNSKFVIYAGTNAVYADNGTATNITGTAPTGSVDDRWTGGVLNGVLIMNNGVDVPTFWGGNTSLDLATLTGWNSTWRAKSIRPFKSYLIALGMTKGTSVFPHMVKWSAPADPGTVPASWDETDPTIDAGEVDLSETPGVIVDGLQMGDNFIVYKADSMYAMTFIGGQFIFQFRRLPGDSGILAPGCACNVPNGHLVLTLDDVIIHSGMGPQSILTNKMRRWLFGSMDITNARRSFVAANPATNEAWICFPEAGQAACTKALVWNWVDNTFTIRELKNATYATAGQYEFTESDPWDADAATWDSDATFWNQTSIPAAQARFLMSTTAPALRGIDAGPDFAGTAMLSRIERVGLAFDAPDRVKLLRAVYPRVDGQGAVFIQVASSMDVEGPYTWSAPVTYTVGSTYKADVFASGRFLGYRIFSTGNDAWRVRSLDLDIVPQGEY